MSARIEAARRPILAEALRQLAARNAGPMITSRWVAYREGWERTFVPPVPPPTIRRCPFPLRPGMTIDVYLPSDLRLADLRRLVWYLVTMCDDWEPEQGFPSFAWPEHR
jgi:hypothetical protein